MDPKAVAEEQIVLERIRRKIEEVNGSGQSQEHISFTLLVHINFYNHFSTCLRSVTVLSRTLKGIMFLKYCKGLEEMATSFMKLVTLSFLKD